MYIGAFWLAFGPVLHQFSYELFRLTENNTPAVQLQFVKLGLSLAFIVD